MATKPLLKRKSDGKVLSDKVFDWSGWGWQFSYAKTHTTGGMPVEDSRGGKYRQATISCRFCPDYPDSTPANFDRIITALARKQDLTFRDVFGDTYTVRISGEELPEPRYRTDIKSREIFEVQITIRGTALEPL